MAFGGQGCDKSSLAIRNMILNQFTEPVVLKNKLTTWKTVPWSLDDFSFKYGNVSLNFRLVPRELDSKGLVWEGSTTYVQATIKQFFEWLDYGEVVKNIQNPLCKYSPCDYWLYSSYNYMFQIFPEESDIIKDVNWEPLGFEGRNGKESSFWIGSSGAYTPCHLDTYGCNLVAQICGRKRWILFPPNDRDMLYPTRVPYEESSIFSSVNILNPDLQLHPLFQKSHPYIVTLEPGDVLFVPKHWWHFVQCLDASVSINTWIDLKSDNKSRLDEAVTRALITSLVQTYGLLNSSWINPSEELASAEENLMYIMSSASRCSDSLIDIVSQNEISCDCRGTEKNEDTACTAETFKSSEYCDVHSDKSPTCINVLTNSDIICVRCVCYSEYLKVVGANKHSSESFDQPVNITNRDIVNCFVHPDVVSVICQKLQQLNICAKTNLCD